MEVGMEQGAERKRVETIIRQALDTRPDLHTLF